MKKLQILLISVLFTACSGGINDFDKTIESADIAYDQFDLKKSRRILEAVFLTDTVQNEQKCIVLRKLAHQDWKYYKDYGLAKIKLFKADSIGDSKFDTWMLISRIERESHNFNDALNSVLKAEKFATSQSEKNKAKIGFAQVVFDLSVNQIEKGELIDTNVVIETSELLSALLKTEAGMPKPSKLLLGISLMNNDGENVLEAWQSYFQVQDIEHTYPYILSSAEKLNQVCKNWHGNKLSIVDQEILIDALASSRLYEFIPVFTQKNDDELNYNQRTKDVIIYSNYLKEIKDATDEYYRLIAIEKEDEKKYKKWLNSKREELWYNLSFLSQKRYSESDFLDETEKHFGARGFTGGTGNYNGYVLCLGHIVNQEQTQIKQYGYKPEFTYTQIDMMVSNGYSSWFWEAKAIGGWATENEIIRVREVYLNGPFEAWKTISDTIERQKTEITIREFLNQSGANQIEQSKGLSVKLRFDALYDLYEDLSSMGLSGQELKLSFLTAYANYRSEASLLAHEGRHSIEKKYLPEEFEKWDNEKREYHAKLSQIVFAAEPRLELAGMVNDTKGNSGHAKANKRILDVAIEWIKRNKAKIAAYSDKKSEFSQIYLMTVEQIKECYQQADPLNK